MGRRSGFVRLTGWKIGELLSFTLGEKPLLIGRSPRCDVVIDDENVSRKHATVQLTDVGIVVRDLESANGTRVGGDVLDADHPEHRIEDGARVAFADAVFKFFDSDDCDVIVDTFVVELRRLDGLTGVENRRTMFEALANAVTRNAPATVALVTFDLDHFKRFNDAHGHLEGDRALQRVARTASACLDARGRIFRFGGEEFAVLIEGTTKDEAMRLAERMRVRFEHMRIRTAGARTRLTASFGVAMLDEARQHTEDAWLRLVDERCAQAKNAGRNRIDGHLQVPVGF